ncbi:MAG: hypothetical protein HOV87_00385 [Catenulispora sp.]|nr:hypothetical protein [Catenulispora sp.]
MSTTTRKRLQGRGRIGVLAVAVATIAGLLALGSPAQATTASSAGAGAHPGMSSSDAGLSPEAAALVKGTGPEARQKALAAYWTPARMQAAIPEDQLLKMLPPAAAKLPSTGGAKPQGAAGQVGPAAGKATVSAGTGVTPNAAAYYPNYPVGSPPAATNGKVYGTYYINGSYINYQCSAATVNSEGKSTVWTAGHCVTDTQTWATNWAFVPNCYNNGSGGCVAPYGVWYAKQLWTPTAYLNNNNDLCNDVGAVVMYPQFGYEIDNYLGGQGIQWNAGIGQYMYAFGYPVPGFTGVNLVAASDYTYQSPFDNCTVYMPNNMTGGSSGGPWLSSFNGSYGYIDGHNDFRYNGYNSYMWSPYYGNQVASLYGSVRYLVG